MMDAEAEVPTTEPEGLALRLNLEPALLETKVQALRSQASQIEPYIDVIGLAQFHDIAGDEYFRAPRADDWP